jgi:hypothetical protein
MSLLGLGALCVWLAFVAVSAVRRWFRLARAHKAWLTQWQLAPSVCAVCREPAEDPRHVPADLESRVAWGHRFVEARLVLAPGPVLLHEALKERVL